ncbi:hypothetical protein FIBSPDRAFT_727730 [Athelia psychrophila]|uniref:SWIM-type domain-containing protein n=1 Tax=Athelia psychrophila TaxID=1759441 RepID=A0A166SB76_9AGAM|nr:hypothetical protein FIBSPDRAFT_727730 [Fibularhizoctonia sp. CBS 109695]
MISSNGTESTIDFFLVTLRYHNPGVIFKIFMCDFDWATINSIRRRYPESLLLLCWWHVLHAWQQHFVISHYPELWALLKTWHWVTDDTEFWTCWKKIQTLAVPSFIDYIERYWLPQKDLWSAVSRKNRTVFEQNDTNMLVEAWHHLLKGKMLEGTQNRRLDHLIWVLLHKCVPYFVHRHWRQQFGFEGPDLEAQQRTQANERGQAIPPTSITEVVPSRIYTLRSQSNPQCLYTINREAYNCECPAFPTISFCKHMAAVQFHYPEADDQTRSTILIFTPPVLPFQQPVTNLSSSSAPTNTILANKLRDLSIHIRHSDHRTSSLIELDDLANRALLEHEQSQILPTKNKIASNEGPGWKVTRAIMGADVKTGPKRAHPDPFSGGERSGKRAKADAQKPLHTQATAITTM